MKYQSFDTAFIIYHIWVINTCTVRFKGCWKYSMSMDTDCICSETKSFHQVIACFFSWLLLPILVPVCLNTCRIITKTRRLILGVVEKTQGAGIARNCTIPLLFLPPCNQEIYHAFCPLLYSGKEPSLEKAEDAESEIMMNRYFRERTYFATTKYGAI